MKFSEVDELLKLISTYDRRPFTPKAVEVWAAELGRIEYQDAVEAVRTIFRTNGHDDRGNVRTLLPADVRRPAQAIAETRYRREAAAANRKALGAAQVRRGSTGRPAAVERALADARAKAAAAAEKYRPVAA
jgi:hypothetical protein